jgi:hypothetical protein
MKGPFGEVYPYHHHLHNQMLNGASNGLFRSGDQQTAPSQANAAAAAHFAASTANNNSLHFPSAFVAFHNSQMAAAAAAAAAVGQQRPTQLESNFNPASSFHYPPHG